MENKLKQSFVANFNIDDARMFTEVSKVTRDTVAVGYYDNKPAREELVPIDAVKYILDQLERHYVPEKFI